MLRFVCFRVNLDSVQSEANALLKRLNETAKKVDRSVEEVKEQYAKVLEVSCCWCLGGVALWLNSLRLFTLQLTGQEYRYISDTPLDRATPLTPHPSDASSILLCVDVGAFARQRIILSVFVFFSPAHRFAGCPPHIVLIIRPQTDVRLFFAVFTSVSNTVSL